MKQRIARVNSLIQEELSKILIREMEFPGALVTVTQVATSKNMRTAIIKISVLPSDKAAESLRDINRNFRHLRHLLGESVKLKPMPEIVFEIDPTPN